MEQFLKKNFRKLNQYFFNLARKHSQPNLKKRKKLKNLKKRKKKKLKKLKKIKIKKKKK